jgi:serine/threonine protein kinase
VKILNARRPEREAYRRFRDEIQALEQLGEHPGVLPSLEAHLPKRPTTHDPAWLAMPVAETLRDYLADAELETVVQAIASVAETLDDLNERGIAHRDIKPENLYRYDDRWVIGDFGLVEFPEKEALTIAGQKLGPAHFVAPEMVTHPERADGGSADVYSLAKTLWVLATGQRWPPPGEIRVDRPNLLLSAYVAGDRARLLDRLLARASQHNPSDRPKAGEFARGLRAWLSTPAEILPPPSLSEIAEQIAAFDASDMERLRAQGEVRVLVSSAVGRLKDQLDRVNSQLHELIPRAGGYGSSMLVLELGHLKATEQVVGYAATRFADTERLNLGALVFYAAIAGGLTPDDHAALGAAYVIMDNRRKDVVWHDERIVEPGTAEEEHAVRDLANGLAKNLEDAVYRFLEILNNRRDDVD